jgi:hypothetical protein
MFGAAFSQVDFDLLRFRTHASRSHGSDRNPVGLATRLLALDRNGLGRAPLSTPAVSGQTR